MNDVVSDDVIIWVVLIVIELSDRNMIFDGRKIEFWMKKITALMTWLFDVSMFNVNSNNEQWINNVQ